MKPVQRKKKTAPSFDDSKYHLEHESEASILGSHFAYAIAAIATGNKDRLTQNKPKVNAFRKIFYEDPQYNSTLNQASVSAGFDAHIIEEKSHWSQKGSEFAHEPRKFGTRPDVGPKKPTEFPFVFEKPIKAFERGTGEVRPFSKVKKISSQARLHYHPPEPVVERPLSPDRYRLPDPWVEASKPVLGVVPQSAAFKSKTERFPAPKVYYQQQLEEKEERSRSPSESRPRSTKPTSPLAAHHSQPESENLTPHTPKVAFTENSTPITTQITSHVSIHPTISFHGMEGSESLQVGIAFNNTSDHPRPRTADSPTPLNPSDPSHHNNWSHLQRAKSADTIRKNRVPGHTFAKFPRNTSPKTKKMISKILQDSNTLERDSIDHKTRSFDNLRLEIDIDVRPLSRGNNYSASPPTTPSHPAVQLEPPILFSDDLYTPRPQSALTDHRDSRDSEDHPHHSNSHPTTTKMASTSPPDSRPRTSSAGNKRSNSYRHLLALNQPTIMPLRESRPMCYTKKSLKDLFVLDDYPAPRSIQGGLLPNHGLIDTMDFPVAQSSRSNDETSPRVVPRGLNRHISPTHHQKHHHNPLQPHYQHQQQQPQLRIPTAKLLPELTKQFSENSYPDLDMDP